MNTPCQPQQEAAMGDSETVTAAAAELHYEIVNTYDDAFEDERLQASVRLFEIQQGPLPACSCCGYEIRPSEGQFAAMSSWVDLSVAPPVVHALLARDVGLTCQMCQAKTAAATVSPQEESISAAASEPLPSEQSADGLEVEERTELICGEVQGTTVRTAKMDVSYSRYYLLSLRRPTKGAAAPDPASTTELQMSESEHQTLQPADQEPTRVDSPAGAAAWAAAHSDQLSAADAGRLRQLEFAPSVPAVKTLSHVLMAVADWVLGPQSLNLSPGDAGFACGPGAPLLVRLRPWAFAARANDSLQLYGSRVRPSLLCLGGSRLGKPPTCLLELLNAPPNRFSAAREVMESAAAAAAGRRRQDGAGREVASYCASWVLPIQRLAALMKRHFNKTQGPWQLSASRLQGRLEALLEGDAVYVPQPRQQLSGRRGTKTDTPGSPPAPVEALLRDLGATPQQVLEVLSLAEIDGNVGFCSECGCTGDLVACDICVDSFCTDCLGGVNPDDLPDPWNCRFCARFPHLQAQQPVSQTAAAKRRQEQPAQDAPGMEGEQPDGKRARLTAQTDQPVGTAAAPSTVPSAGKRRQDRPPKRPVSMPPAPLLPLSPNIMTTPSPPLPPAAIPASAPPPAVTGPPAVAEALAAQVGPFMEQSPPDMAAAVVPVVPPKDPRLRARAVQGAGDGGARGRDKMGPDAAAVSVVTEYSSDASGPGAGARRGREARAQLGDLGQDGGARSGDEGGNGGGGAAGSGGGGPLRHAVGLPPLPYGGRGSGTGRAEAAAAAGPSHQGDASAPVVRGAGGSGAGGSGRGRGRGRGKGRPMAAEAAAALAASVLTGAGGSGGPDEGSLADDGPGSSDSQHAAAALLLLTMQQGGGKEQQQGPEQPAAAARRKSGQKADERPETAMLLAASAGGRQPPGSSHPAEATTNQPGASGAVPITAGEPCSAVAVGDERQQHSQPDVDQPMLEAQHQQGIQALSAPQQQLPAVFEQPLQPVPPNRNTSALMPAAAGTPAAPAPAPAPPSAPHTHGNGTLDASETLPLTAAPSSTAWPHVPGDVMDQPSTRVLVAAPAEPQPQPAPSATGGRATEVGALGPVSVQAQQPPAALGGGTMVGVAAAGGGTLASRGRGVACGGGVGQALSLEEATLLGFQVLQIAAEAGVDAGVVATWMAVLNAALEHYGAQPALSSVVSSCLHGLCSGRQLHPTILKASTEMLARLLRPPEPQPQAQPH